MTQSTAVWLVIVLALVAANLPFLVQRPLLLLPAGAAQAGAGATALRWLESLVFFGVLVLLWRGAYAFIGTALVLASDPASRLLFYGRIALYVCAFGAVLAWPGWRQRGAPILKKPFSLRLLELLVLYIGVGVLGLALEFNFGSRFTQTWEFYAITGALFVVLGYPGFVVRYLLKRSKPPRERRDTAQNTAGAR